MRERILFLLRGKRFGAIELGQRDPSLTALFKLADGLGIQTGELLGMPDMSADIEAAKLVTALPFAVREPLVDALRALAAWEGRRP